MGQVIEILTSLGINETVYYQFGIFFIAYISMSYIVFKPYLRAFQERQSRTIGGQQQASEFLQEAEAKEEQYKSAAKKLNIQIKEIFGLVNGQAKLESDQIISATKLEIEKDNEQSRQELEVAVIAARKEMDQFVPEISQNIQKKFIGQ